MIEYSNKIKNILRFTNNDIFSKQKYFIETINNCLNNYKRLLIDSKEKTENYKGYDSFKRYKLTKKRSKKFGRPSKGKIHKLENEQFHLNNQIKRNKKFK